MKTMIRYGCTALIALAFGLARADAAPPVERHDTPTARARSGAEVLASWTGSIRGAARDETATGSGYYAAVAGAHSGTQVLASWTGAISGAADDGRTASSGHDTAISSRSAAQILASWTGSISGG